MLKVGSKAPAFNLPADDGTIVALKDLKGQKVILFFYPKDMTSGCTIEARAFRDDLARFTKKGAVIL
ncbi:MAG: peroxiredoxin Q/BCP, partial [bacterium]